jgi:hypothetical protein
MPRLAAGYQFAQALARAAVKTVKLGNVLNEDQL